MDRRLFLCGAATALGVSVIPKLNKRNFNDIVPGCSQLGSKKSKRNKKLVKWAKSDLTYCIYNRDDGELGPIQWDIEFSKAFNSWERVTNFKFNRIHKPDNADIVIVASGHPAESFGEVGKVLAWAQMPTSARHKSQLITKYDIAEKWLDEAPGPLKEGEILPGYRGIHLEAVACHEIGHIIGLHHLPYANALMYPTYSPDIATPQDVDIAYAKYLYKR
jgi:predicted Zn-dependent protease